MLNQKVSVIIPVFNSERFLIKSIESVLNQTYKNIEIITINDGSTENSQIFLQRYSDKLTIISHENLIGICVQKCLKNLVFTNSYIVIFDYSMDVFDLIIQILNLVL